MDKKKKVKFPWALHIPGFLFAFLLQGIIINFIEGSSLGILFIIFALYISHQSFKQADKGKWRYLTYFGVILLYYFFLFLLVLGFMI